jgi:hypothetical protein
LALALCEAAEGWLVEALCDLEASSAAYALPAARSAATAMASFLEVIPVPFGF